MGRERLQGTLVLGPRVGMAEPVLPQTHAFSPFAFPGHSAEGLPPLGAWSHLRPPPGRESLLHPDCEAHSTSKAAKSGGKPPGPMELPVMDGPLPC